MGFLLTAALVLQTLLGNAAGEEQESYDYFSYWNGTFFFYGNYTYDDLLESYQDNYTDIEILSGKNVTESAGSSLQGHLPFFVVLLHLLCFLLQRFIILL